MFKALKKVDVQTWYFVAGTIGRRGGSNLSILRNKLSIQKIHEANQSCKHGKNQCCKIRHLVNCDHGDGVMRTQLSLAAQWTLLTAALRVGSTKLRARMGRSW